MKRFIYSIAALAMALFAGSCAKDSLAPTTDAGTVTFTVEAPGTIGTKAIADGTNVDEVHYAVYLREVANTHENSIDNAAGVPLVQGSVGMQNKTATVTFNLLVDQKYTVIFWAQVKDKGYYELGDLRNISLAANAAVYANDESRAAFFRAYDFETPRTNGETVVLYRPFSQLNLCSTKESLQPAQGDNATTSYSIDPTHSTVKVKGVYTSFNTVTGEAAEPQDVEFLFAEAAIPNTADGKKIEITVGQKTKEYEAITVEKDGADVDYAHLGMNYFFAPSEGSTVVVEYDIKTDKGTINNTITNIPVKENYRTNIIGNLLTKQTEIVIIVDERFVEDMVEGEESLGTLDRLADVLENGGTFQLLDNLTLNGESLVIPAGVEVNIDLNGYTLSNAVDGPAVLVNGTLNMTDGKVLNTKVTEGETSGKNQGIAVSETGVLTLDNVNVGSTGSTGNAIRNNGGNITINGGTFAAGDRDQDIAYAYVFYQTAGTMVVNDATVNSNPNGIFSCNAGTISVNGGSYKIGNGTANTWYLAFTSTDGDPDNAPGEGTIYLNSGNYEWNKGSSSAAPTLGNVIISSEAKTNWEAETQTVIRTQADFEAALANGGTILLGVPTTVKSYSWKNTNSNFDIVAAEEGVEINIVGYAYGASFAGAKEVSFNGVTLNFNNEIYTGFQSTTAQNYTNCTINGMWFLYGTEASFNGCTLNQTDPGKYNMWTYGVKTVNFKNCAFNCAGKSVLIYNEGATGTKATFDNCTLTASAPANDGKAAIEIGSSLLKDGDMHIVNINNTTATGFDKGSSSNNILYNQKEGEKAQIYVDGVLQANDVTTLDRKNYTIHTAKGLFWLAEQVNENGNTFSGKTITLGADIDLANAAWTPIGLNADKNDKFKGTFDGNGKTISNLNVNTEAGYTAAGFFGALNGTAKNFTIKGATIEHISTGSATDNGTAVVAGSIYSSGTIESVNVENAAVKGNRYLGGIAGYVYGNIKNCSVSTIEIVATPDNLTGAYDNGDKVGGIAGYFASEATYTISGNSVKNFTIQGYRDCGGIVGAGDNIKTWVLNNTAANGTITVDQTINSYEPKDANAGAIVGRVIDADDSVDASNTSSDVTIVENLQK